MKKDNKLSIINSVQVLVSPWEKGFTCGIMLNENSKISSENYELISTIARGMIKIATEEPHKVFTQGMKGFAEDKKNNKIPEDVECIAESSLAGDDESEIIDFLDALKKQRDKKTL